MMNFVKKIRVLVSLAVFSALLGCSTYYTGFEDKFKIPNEKIERIIESKTPYKDKIPMSLGFTVPEGKVKVGADGVKEITLSVDDVIELALKNNETYLAHVEDLALQGLDLELILHNYTPLISPLVISANKNYASTRPESQSLSISTGVSQSLPAIGSSISISASGSASRTYGGGSSYSGSLGTISLSLPIGKKGGFLKNMEPIISAKRSYAYAKRVFEYVKQGILIDIISSYFSILRQKEDIRTYERRLENAKRMLEQAKINYEFGKVGKDDVYSAQNEVLQAENSYKNAIESLKMAEEAFKVDLGIEASIRLNLVKEEVEFKPFEMDLNEAINYALEHNPYWLNTVDEFEDTKRNFYLAYRELLNDVSISASYTPKSVASKSGSLADGFETIGEPSFSVGFRVEIPIDRMTLNVNFQKAASDFIRAKRNFRLSKEGFIRDIKNAYFQLKQNAFSVNLQKQSIEQAERSLELKEIKYKKGEITNRDLLIEQDKLTDAQLNYQSALVNFKINLLRFQRRIGKLSLDKKDWWK